MEVHSLREAEISHLTTLSKGTAVYCSAIVAPAMLQRPEPGNFCDPGEKNKQLVECFMMCYWLWLHERWPWDHYYNHRLCLTARTSGVYRMFAPHWVPLRQMRLGQTDRSFCLIVFRMDCSFQWMSCQQPPI